MGAEQPTRTVSAVHASPPQRKASVRRYYTHTSNYLPTFQHGYLRRSSTSDARTNEVCGDWAGQRPTGQTASVGGWSTAESTATPCPPPAAQPLAVAPSQRSSLFGSSKPSQQDGTRPARGRPGGGEGTPNGPVGVSRGSRRRPIVFRGRGKVSPPHGPGRCFPGLWALDERERERGRER